MVEEIVVLVVFDVVGLVFEVGEFFFWFLGEQVVGDVYGELVLVGQFVNYLVVVWVVLEVVVGVDCVGQVEVVEFVYELVGGVDLVFQWQFWFFGQGGVENYCVGLGDQYVGGFVVVVVDDFVVGWVGCVFGVVDYVQGGVVEQGVIVQVEDEYWGVWCGFV